MVGLEALLVGLLYLGLQLVILALVYYVIVWLLGQFTTVDANILKFLRIAFIIVGAILVVYFLFGVFRTVPPPRLGMGLFSLPIAV